MNLHSIQALTYAFKVWLCAVLLPPFIFLVFMALGSRTPDATYIVYYLIMAIVGALLSSPCFLLLWLASYLLLKHNKSIRHSKSALTPISFVLAIIPFIGWSFGALTQECLFSLPYILSVIGAIWYFKLGDEDQQPSSTIQP